MAEKVSHQKRCQRGECWSKHVGDHDKARAQAETHKHVERRFLDCDIYAFRVSAWIEAFLVEAGKDAEGPTSGLAISIPNSRNPFHLCRKKSLDVRLDEMIREQSSAMNIILRLVGMSQFENTVARQQ
jgi:hypothetical protein